MVFVVSVIGEVLFDDKVPEIVAASSSITVDELPKVVANSHFLFVALASTAHAFIVSLLLRGSFHGER